MGSKNPVISNMKVMISHAGDLTDRIEEKEIETLLTEITKDRRIYLAGAGRSGLIARAFAMRLMHIGIDSYVVGETVTPAMKKGDLVIIFSGSGTTRSMADTARTAQGLGGCICLITAHKNSKISEYADIVITLPSELEIPADDTFEIRQLTGESRSLSQPVLAVSTVFETTALIFADAVIAALAEMKHCSQAEILSRASNIQ